jgi:hypothetical protein
VATAEQRTELEDKAQIRETLLRYAAGVDRKDWALMSSCFTEDTDGVWNGVELHGTQAIVDYINQAAAKFVIRSSAHMFTNIYIELDGDGARSEVYGLAYLVGEHEGGETFMRLRGLRYRDELVRHDGDWRIRRRNLSADWELQTPVTVP